MNKIIKYILSGLIFIYFAFIISNSMDPDFGWHLRIGQQILNTGLVPHADNLTYTMSGHEWVDHEWWINQTLATLYNLRLDWLIIALFAGLTSAPFVYYLFKAKNWLETVAVCSLVLAVSDFIFIRAAVVSFFIFWLFLGHLQGKFDDRFDNKWPFLAKTAFFIWIWANLHAGFFMGLFLLGLFIAWDWVLIGKIYLFKKREWQRQLLLEDLGSQFIKYDIVLFLTCAAVALINPYGWELYGEIIRIATSAETHKYINEWLPPIFSHSFNLLILYVPIAWILFKLKWWKDKRWIFLTFVFFALSLLGVRYFMQLLILSIPLLMHYSNKLQLKVYTSQIWQYGAVLVCLGLLYYVPANLMSRNIQNFYPVEATKILYQYGQFNDIRLFNEYGWGGYISLYAPSTKLFIDGRMPHWKSGDWSLTQEYMTAYYAKDLSKWDDLENKYNINTVLIPADNKLKKYLQNKGWQTLQESSVSVLLTNIINM